MDRMSTIIMPFPTISNFNTSDNSILIYLLKEFKSLKDIYDYHGFFGGVRAGNNMIGRW